MAHIGQPTPARRWVDKQCAWCHRPLREDGDADCVVYADVVEVDFDPDVGPDPRVRVYTIEVYCPDCYAVRSRARGSN